MIPVESDSSLRRRLVYVGLRGREIESAVGEALDHLAWTVSLRRRIGFETQCP